MARHRQDPLPVCHDDMFALAGHTKSYLLQRPNCVQMVDARDLAQGLYRNLEFADLLATQVLVDDKHVLANRIAYVV